MVFAPPVKRLLQQTLRLAKTKRKKIYLVGGYLRDVFLGSTAALATSAVGRSRDAVKGLDLDFCLQQGAINFGRQLSRQLKSGFVVLDKEHGACRLLKRTKELACTFDFSDFRGREINADLRRRDFTINCLALGLEDALAKQGRLDDLIIDPCGGLRDLGKGLIRVPSAVVLKQDPLRILRAFTFAHQFGFRIDAETLRLIKEERQRLAQVSAERIRDELFKVLKLPGAAGYFLKLDKLKILKVVFPELEVMRGVRQGPYHHLDVLRHSLETLRQLEILFAQLKGDCRIQNYLSQQLSAGRSRSSLLKLGALLHDLGKPGARRRKGGRIKFYGHERLGFRIAEGIIRRLRLSNDELDSLKRMILWHLRPGYLADNEEITPRAKFRYFRDAAGEAVSILLLAIADQRATRGRLNPSKKRRDYERVIFGLIEEYFRRQEEKKAPRLVNGDELMRAFGLSPSVLVGRLLSELEELQAIGRVRTKQQALLAAARSIRKAG